MSGAPSFTVHVTAPVVDEDLAWRLLSELERLAMWAPNVDDSPSDPLGPGAVRRVHLTSSAYGKDVLVERIVELHARGFSYEIEGGIGPMHQIRTSWSLRDGQVHVVSSVALRGVARLFRPVARRKWQASLQVLADAFADHVGRTQDASSKA